ncbi:glucose dehydrogenase [Nitrospirales bacterium NOB]|nr:MAG: alcohol dehydrogenase [Nitrospira sp. OLB3]MCK6500970.1 glucose 1-dehydrogenase [Nitrospira sp.]MDL1888407.1 glucose dehydrogenase [Nitrospirales bacterium NOB]RIK57066.1 MAG: glucose dehydrogenase [Nitrospira sp.]
MKAIAVIPGKRNSIHLADLPEPSVSDIINGRGVVVEVLRVGVDGTDKEINAAEYGQAPPGYDFLVIGHECFGRVVEVGDQVWELKPGDYVVPTVRRPGGSFYDKIGQYDMTTEDIYYERGINLRHGYLTEYFVDEPEYIVKVPKALKHVAVLLEPTSVIEKGIIQAYEAQRRLKVWRPKRAAVLGAGTIGMLAAMSLRMRGLEVVSFGRNLAPYRNSELLVEIGARYISTQEVSIKEAAEKYGPFDLMFEATGFAPIVFEAMEHLGKNGALILSSVTGGGRNVQVPADMINLGFVLGNKVMVGTVNANREYFEAGVYDLSRAELEFPGWLSKFLTHPVEGLDNYQDMMRLLTQETSAIKVFVNVVKG